MNDRADKMSLAGAIANEIRSNTENEVGLIAIMRLLYHTRIESGFGEIIQAIDETRASGELDIDNVLAEAREEVLTQQAERNTKMEARRAEIADQTTRNRIVKCGFKASSLNDTDDMGPTSDPEMLEVMRELERLTKGMNQLFPAPDKTQ